MKQLDKVLIVVSVFFSCSVSAEKTYNDIAGYHRLPEAVQAAFRKFDDKVGVCLDSTKNENPYPVSEWLINLPQDKQGSVLMYLSQLALFNCSSKVRLELENVVNELGETRFLAMMQEQGWLSSPVYGEFADSVDNIQLDKDDKAALKILIERDYLPFDVIQTKLALDLLKKYRSQ